MKKWIIILILAVITVSLVFFFADRPQGKIAKTERFQDSVEEFRSRTVEDARDGGIDVLLNGQSLKNFSYDIRMDDAMKLLCPERFLRISWDVRYSGIRTVMPG